MANSDLVVNTTQKMDMLTKQLYIQSRSFDDVVEMCKNHDEMLRCIPAIQPISNKDLRRPLPVMERASTLFTELPVFMPAWTFRPIRERMYMQPVTALLLKWDGKPVMEILSSWIMASVTRRGMPLTGIPYQTRQTGGAGRGYRCGWKYRQKYRTPPALRSACERAGRKSRELLLYGFKCRRLRPYDTDCGKSWKNDGLADYEMFN